MSSPDLPECQHEYVNGALPPPHECKYRMCKKCRQVILDGFENETIPTPVPTEKGNFNIDNVNEVIIKKMGESNFGLADEIVRHFAPIGQGKLEDFVDNKNSMLTVHILRNWDRERTLSFAKHLIGDQGLEEVCASLPSGKSENKETGRYWCASILQSLIDLKSFPNITSRMENATTKSDKIEELIKHYQIALKSLEGGQNHE